MIRKRLLPLLKQHYPSRPFIFSEPPDPIARLPLAHPGLGELQIFDDGDEATIYLTEITHGHFNPYDITDGNARDEWIVSQVIEFLDSLFDDRVLFFRTPDRRMGGWTVFDGDLTKLHLESGREYFCWSKPISNAGS